VVIDILATGVAMRHGGRQRLPLTGEKVAEDAETATRPTGTDYARIISHSG